MAPSNMPSLYDLLSGRQRRQLNAAGRRANIGGQEPVETANAGRVIEILESWLLDDEQKQSLKTNVWDIFFLYAGAGLLAGEKSDRADQPEGNFGINDSDRYAAEFKPESDNRDFAAAAGEAQSEILDLIRSGVLAAGRMAEHIPPRISFGPEGAVNIQFLAACLRLAMGFDFAASRTLAHISRLLPPGAIPAAQNGLDDLFDVRSVGPHPHVQATILVEFGCRDAEVHRALKRYESHLQRLLFNLNRIIRPRFLFTAVQFEVAPLGYLPIDFKFGVDSSSALQLFAGNTLYKDRRVFLRELVQNAVDACSLRQMQEPEYTPSIGVKFTPGLDCIIFRDNGIGMSRQWIEKYFLNIGLSFYQSDEIIRVNRDASIQFSFISQFGIGFLSCFLVARKVVIKTRQAGSDGYVITITRIDDYFDVRTADDEIPVGTEVEVFLKENLLQYCRSLEYLGYLKTNVRFLPIALDFTDEKGTHTVLGREPLNYEEEIHYGTKFCTALDFETSEGYLLLKVKKNHQYIYDLESSKGGVSIFQDGIFITQVDYLLPDSAGGYVIGRLNLVGDEKCELSMDRNRLLWKKGQMAGIKKRILSGLASIVNQLLDTSGRQSPPENIQRNILQKVGSFFDFNEVDDTLYDALNPNIGRQVEDQFRRFVRLHHSRYDLLHDRDGTAANAHGYIHRWQQRVIETYKQKGAGKSRRA